MTAIDPKRTLAHNMEIIHMKVKFAFFIVVLGCCSLLLPGAVYSTEKNSGPSYAQAIALREAILQGNWYGYEQLVGVLGIIEGDEAKEVLIELANYDMGEFVDQALKDTMVHKGLSIVPALRQAVKTNVTCQQQVRSFDKVKKLKCRGRAERDAFLEDVIATIQTKQ